MDASGTSCFDTTFDGVGESFNRFAGDESDVEAGFEFANGVAEKVEIRERKAGLGMMLSESDIAKIPR